MQIPSSYIHIQNLLNPGELAQLETAIAQMPFVDGKTTATGAAKEAKNNLQATKEDNEHRLKAQQIVMNAIATHPLIQAFAMPKLILPPIISQYEPGMNYGWHTDSPIMGDAYPVRIDMSMTLFLSAPETYTGGELVIHTPTGYVNFKLNKGDAIIYPTTRLHCVNPVTQGVRVAAVTWMQSFIKDTEKRELVMLVKTIQEMIASNNINSSENLMLLQVYSNLVRMWAEN